MAELTRLGVRTIMEHLFTKGLTVPGGSASYAALFKSTGMSLSNLVQSAQRLDNIGAVNAITDAGVTMDIDNATGWGPIDTVLSAQNQTYDYVGIGKAGPAPDEYLPLFVEASAGTNPVVGTAFAAGDFKLSIPYDDTPTGGYTFEISSTGAKAIIGAFMSGLDPSIPAMPSAAAATLTLLDSAGVEVSGNGYSAVTWLNGFTQVIDAGGGYYYENTTILTFPTPTGTWADVTFMTVSIAGTSIWIGKFPTPLNISAGSLLEFAMGAIRVGFQYNIAN